MISSSQGTTGPRIPVRVRVNYELALDAGSCVELTGSHGRMRVVLPPEMTLFHQVLAYLEEKPDPPKRPPGPMVGREGAWPPRRLPCAGAGHLSCVQRN